MKFANLFDEAYHEIKRSKVAFFVVFFLSILLTYSILFAADFIPEPVEQSSKTQEIEGDEEDVVTEKEEDVPVVETPVAPLPLKIIFDSLDKEVTVLNPTSRTVEDLDTALLSGAVRHPDSADFENEGNIFILAHSSYLPTVFNKNFQAFNGIQDLVWGDIIRLQSEDTEYVYRVQKVYEAKTSEVFVPQTPGKAQLTLATCNSFGSKDDRFMVEAMLIESNPL